MTIASTRTKLTPVRNVGCCGSARWRAVRRAAAAAAFAVPGPRWPSSPAGRQMPPAATRRILRITGSPNFSRNRRSGADRWPCADDNIPFSRRALPARASFPANFRGFRMLQPTELDARHERRVDAPGRRRSDLSRQRVRVRRPRDPARSSGRWTSTPRSRGRSSTSCSSWA